MIMDSRKFFYLFPSEIDFLFLAYGRAQKRVKMTEIGKSKIQVLIKVEYYLSDLKVLDLNSYVFSHGWNPNYSL